MTPANKIKPGDRIRVKGRTVKVTKTRDWGKHEEPFHITYEAGNFSGVLACEYDREIGKAGTQ